MGLRALAQLGLLAALSKVSTPVDKFKRLDHQGRDIGDTMFFTYFQPRSFGSLSQPAQSKTHAQKKVSDIKTTETGVVVSCTDGTSYEGSMVIGADGAYSVVRKHIQLMALREQPAAKEERPFLTTYRAFWMLMPLIPGLKEGVVKIWSWGGHHAGQTLGRDGDLYATAGSQEKRDRLTREYGIPAERIFSSRDASFAPAVLAATEGRGVDVVLNSLPGPLLQASLSVIAPLGHLIEFGKKEIETNSLVALECFSRGISLASLDVPTLLRRRGPDIHRILGEVTRLHVQDAFRFLQTGPHMGKVVLPAGPEEVVPVVPRPKGITPRPRLRSDASYLVVGGVGGIGRSIAHWLVDHGAQNLILLSRSAGDLDLAQNQNAEGALFVRELRAAGCRVKPVSCDIALASSLAKALRACEDEGLPPVRGVIQGAMLLRDAIFEQMTLADWKSGLAPKLNGSWNLHTEFSTRGGLDFFVMLSSVSGVIGIASQTNYAAGGSYEDALARWRQARGLPGVSIDLGPISDIGYVSQEAKVAERLRKDGDFAMLDEEIVLRALNAAVLYPLGTSSRPQLVVGLNSEPGPQWDPAGGSQLGRDARFLHLRPRRKASPHGKAADGGADSSKAASLIGAAIASKLADIFMAPVTEIDLSKPPAHFGVDSLIAVELRNMLVLQAAADISIFNLLQTPSLAALAASVAEKSRHL
ncbi:hypothetical protein KXV81_008084 [Aspergillus fumigatus]|nr:hypothetical protein KXX60_008002 [Aspergillus fumigatus]KAH1869850.1 hypothetical protein KXW95_007665 [Aspergillus fumigatus]KAH2134311.1 hypothetical protein KXW66_004943 [Aspergillus fumigatus]KAH2676889.1 hypothetical protein KXV96_009351 [Aspergillus fumigatus]KAH3397668.1 hypothetical protein KXW79_008118 [Aspergillus fumigatus]